LLYKRNVKHLWEALLIKTRLYTETVMSRNIQETIKSEYEKKQRLAFENLMRRKNEVYLKVPLIRNIDDEIQHLGVKYNKMILISGCSHHDAVNKLSAEIDRLQKERAELLVKSGFPSNYLETVYSCPACKDSGQIEHETGFVRCSCYKQHLIDLLYKMSNLKLTGKENFNFFDESLYPDTANETRYGIKKSPKEHILGIKEKCMKFIENFDSPEEKNLYFCGPAGIGKTFMASCIAYEILNRGKTVLYQTAPILFDTISEYKLRAFKDEGFDDNGYKSIFDVELLIIDDLGTESPSAARLAELLNILNIRQINSLSRPCKTIISTNIEAHELYEYYKERVASRIIGCFNFFKFAGEDIRRIKKQQQSGIV
jgi:DNA replication protein DnaC